MEVDFIDSEDNDIDIREWLNQIRYFDKQIELIKKRHSTYNKHRKLLMEMASEFADGINLCTRITEQRINTLFRLRGQVEQIIAQIKCINKRLTLESYFLNDKTTAEIAQDEYFSKRHIERLLEDGIKEVEIMMSKKSTTDTKHCVFCSTIEVTTIE